MAEDHPIIEEVTSDLEEFEQHYELFGLNLVEVLKFMVAIGIIIAALTLRKFVSGFILKLVEGALPDNVRATVEKLLTGPLSFATIFGGFYLSAQILRPPPELEFVFERILQTVVNIAIFWVGFQLVEPLANFWMFTSATKHDFGEEIKEIFTKVVKSVIAAFGVLAIFDVWGINVAGFLAGLGLAGMAVAFGAQDTVKNLFGSFLIIADRVFHKGEFIITPDVSGIIEHFGIRVTQIRKLDTTLVFVPNSTLVNSTITNLTRGKRREISWSPKLDGGLDPHVISNVVEETRKYLHGDSQIEQEETKPLVHVADVSDGTVQLMVYFHFKMMPWNEHVAARERVALAFKRIVETNHARFALPTRVLLSHKA